ncbi:MAG TPA: SUMF1/EgtB/PvdO family nonheme iron enzyme, partial [Bryobacteraceae bacterium]|nr:SUMF1/EgtB/PvdO family nonheme iron enzyme [Bryobacteraceae bacterium]
VVVGIGLYLALKPKELPKTIQAKSGVMVLVPAGPFLYGEKKVSVSLPAFYIDKAEVTNAAYKAFCDATGHTVPDQFPADHPELPVVNVSILDAKDFADWAGERLPRAKEWEKAARGTQGFVYPWGNQKDPARANAGPDGTIRPSNDFPNGASSYGALQMVGNVWELVYELQTPSTAAVEYFHNRLDPPPTANDSWYQIRGGSFKDPIFTDAVFDNVIWDSTTIPAKYKDTNIGFRCVKDAQQQ